MQKTIARLQRSKQNLSVLYTSLLREMRRLPSTLFTTARLKFHSSAETSTRRHWKDTATVPPRRTGNSQWLIWWGWDTRCRLWWLSRSYSNSWIDEDVHVKTPRYVTAPTRASGWSRMRKRIKKEHYVKREQLWAPIRPSVWQEMELMTASRAGLYFCILQSVLYIALEFFNSPCGIL